MSEIEEESSPRPLVSVQKIVSIDAIPGKDRVSLATLEGGWKSVVENGKYRAGSLVVFHEPDSYVPVEGPSARPCYSFLLPDSKACPAEDEGRTFSESSATAEDVRDRPTRRTRIRTKKFSTPAGKPVFSQGLIVPMGATELAGNYHEGDDLTGALGVIKYDPSKKGEKIHGPADERLRDWPRDLLQGIERTDEVRLQSHPGLLKEFHGRTVAVTYKIDGASTTIARLFGPAADGIERERDLIICSRSKEHLRSVAPPTDILAKVLGFEWLSKIPPGYAIQGELAGPGIQGNRAGFPNVRLYAFNVFRRFSDDDAFEELPFKEARGFCKDHGIPAVPVILSGWLVESKEPFANHVASEVEAGNPVPTKPRHDVATFVAMATTKYGNGFACEGIVVRPMTPDTSEILRGKRLSFKCINPNWEAIT